MATLPRSPLGDNPPLTSVGYRISTVRLNRHRTGREVIASLRAYQRLEDAEHQVAIWQRVFPENRYFITPAPQHEGE
jgi:hypothetical protein